MKFEKHIEIDAGDRKVAQVLVDAVDLSKQALKRAMQKGCVWLTRNKGTQRVRRFDKVLRADDTLHIYYDDRVLSSEPQAAVLIADEALYSVWYKPYGMLCQGSKWGDHCTINRWVERHLEPQRPAFIIHRLDRAAQGLILIAHQKRTAASLADLFQRRQVDKRYRAIVHGHLAELMTLDGEIDGKPAVSHVVAVDYAPGQDRSLVEVTIESGRKHQIRRHLSRAGFPIVGDRLYGREGDEQDLCLVSCYLSFVSPTDGIRKIYTLPESLQPGL